MAEAQPADPDLVADAPFTTAASHENIGKCIKGIPPDELDNLSLIQRIYYNFDPFHGGDGSAGKPDVNISRYIEFSLPDVSRAGITRILSSLNSDACEATVRVSYPNVLIPDSRHIIVSFHYDVGGWDCSSWLGIPTKTYLGSAWADVRTVYAVGDDLKIAQVGSPQISNEGQTTDVLGQFISGLRHFGAPIATLLVNSIVVHLSMHVSLADRTEADKLFTAFTSGTSALQSFTASLDLMQAPYWPLMTDGASSGFLPNETTNPVFILKQSTSVPSGEGVLAYSLRKSEIAFIRDLSKPSPRLHMVARRENLWSISKKTYADPRIYLLIEDQNKLRGKALRIGQNIRLPLLYELCQEVVVDDNLVRPGDTIEAIRKRRNGLYNPKAKEFRSRNLNRIYPYESTAQ